MIAGMAVSSRLHVVNAALLGSCKVRIVIGRPVFVGAATREPIV